MQTFLRPKLFPCIHAADHTFEKLRIYFALSGTMILNIHPTIIPPVVLETHATPCSRSWGQLWGQLRGLTFNFLSNFAHWNDYSVASLATTPFQHISSSLLRSLAPYFFGLRGSGRATVFHDSAGSPGQRSEQLTIPKKCCPQGQKELPPNAVD